MADSGHKYIGEKKGVTLHLIIMKTLFRSSVGKLNYLSGFRRHLDSSNSALATIDTFHASHGHVHEKLLRSTAKQLGVVLEASLRECEG